MIFFRTLLVAGLAVAVSLVACREESGAEQPPAEQTTPDIGAGKRATESEMPQPEAETRARQLVTDAAAVIQKMKTDAKLEGLMKTARGIFIVPSYGQIAVGVGGSGGKGVMLARMDESWSEPAFYSIGEISVGAQLGATGGSIAMLLMSDRAVAEFNRDTSFSLDADAGFTLVDYSASAQARLGAGEDVIFWSETEGAFAGAALGVTAISWDETENAAYYGQEVTAGQVLTGEVKSPQGSEVLRSQLPT